MQFSVRSWMAAAALAVGLLGMSASPAAAQTIDTRSSGLRSDVAPLGADPNGHATFGQTFTALNNQLDSFEFRYGVIHLDGLASNPVDPVDFRFYVMGWNNATNRAEGPVLFESATTTASTTYPGDYYAFNTGGVALTAGNAYVGFFSTSALPAQPGKNQGFAATRIVDNDSHLIGPGVYSGGTFVFASNGSDFSKLTSEGWMPFRGEDLDFKAEFSSSASAVPEPASLALMLPGLGAVALLKRRRRSA